MRTKLRLMVLGILAFAAVPAVADESGAPVFDLTPDDGAVTSVTMPQSTSQAETAPATAEPAKPAEVTAAPTTAPAVEATAAAATAEAPKIATKPAAKKSERKPASVKSARKKSGKSLRRPASNRFLSDESRNVLEAEVAEKGAKIQDDELNLAQAILKNVEATHRCTHKEIEKAAAAGAKYRVVFQCANKIRSRVYFRIFKKKLRFSAVQLRYNKAEDVAELQATSETTMQPVAQPAATQETAPQTSAQ